MKKYKLFIIVSTLAYVFSACNFSNNNSIEVDMKRNPIVTVKDLTLYKDDLERVIPHHLSTQDSTLAANKYIRSWINEGLLYDKAKQNAVNSTTIEQLVEDYRKSLIINSYRERILKEHFEKTITKGNLEAYYKKNPDLFALDECIIKGLYLKIPISSPQLNNFKKWYTQTNEDAMAFIEKNALQNTVGYELFYDRWSSLSSIMSNIPYIVRNSEQFLKQQKHLEVRDSSYVYLLNISEFKLTGTLAPYEYIKDQLGEMYKEQNRTNYLENIQNDLYDKAIADKQIIHY